MQVMQLLAAVNVSRKDAKQTRHKSNSPSAKSFDGTTTLTILVLLSFFLFALVKARKIVKGLVIL